MKSRVSRIKVGFATIDNAEYIIMRGFDLVPNSNDEWAPRAGISVRLDHATAVADLLDMAICQAEHEGKLKLPASNDGDEP